MPTPDPSPSDTPRSLADAVRRLEEVVGFLGRDQERASAEMAEVWARLAALERRIAGLEEPPPKPAELGVDDPALDQE
ncbi:MAG: hypothetical protein FJ255_06265 [Phycisphaerae bacterium]|nr:hypothetical protein [Phycisphaerae bacterium]